MLSSGRHLQNNLSHLLPSWWCWYCGTKYQKYNISKRRTFDIGRRYKEIWFWRPPSHWDWVLNHFFLFLIQSSRNLISLSDKSSSSADGSGWIMKGELLNFLKSALKLGPENGEGGIEMKSTFSNGGNSWWWWWWWWWWQWWRWWWWWTYLVEAPPISC